MEKACIGSGESVIERDAGLPAELGKSRDIHYLAWHAVRLAAIVNNARGRADDPTHFFRQRLDGVFLAAAYVDERRTGVADHTVGLALHEKNAGVTQVVAEQVLARWRSAAPNGHRI